MTQSGDQTIPILFSRDREIPLCYLKADRKLRWEDLPEEADYAITNKAMDVILFHDLHNIVCLFKTSGGLNLRRHVEGKGMTKEWLYNYSILYINTTDYEANIDVRDRDIYRLGGIRDEGSNMKRCVNHTDNDETAMATYFPVWLKHTRKEEDPSLKFLFQVKYGQKRSLTSIESYTFK